MHISSTKALASSTLTAAATYTGGGVPGPERSISPSAWAVLVPMTAVLTLLALLYPVQVRTRKSLGEMMRKLSVTASQ